MESEWSQKDDKKSVKDEKSTRKAHIRTAIYWVEKKAQKAHEDLDS